MASISYLQVKQNATSVRAVVVMESNTTGGINNASPTSLVYFRDGDTSVTSVGLTVGTLGTWASGSASTVGIGGCYEISLPNAMFTNAARQVTAQCYTGSSEGNLLIQIVPSDVSVGVTVTGSVVASSVTAAVVASSVTGNVTVGGYALGKDPYTSVMQTVDSVDALTNADTLEKRIRLFAAALLGKVSGMGASAPIFRNITDTKNRITATSDSIGDRTAVTLDGS